MEKKAFTLYWSSLATFEDCPQKFLWGRGWPTIDLGFGLGKRKPKPEKKSEHHAIMGTAIQFGIENFYNQELWKQDPETLKRSVIEYAMESYRLESARKYIDWRAAGDSSELEKIIREGTLGYLRTMKEHKLLGPYARAEVEYLGYVAPDVPVGGRADVVIQREDTGVTILDGKNSKRYKNPKTGAYDLTHTDPDQLRWYALLFYLNYQKLPDRLGFVYYRYPVGTPILDAQGLPTGRVESGVDWVPSSMEDVQGLATRAITAVRAMDREEFEAKPSPTNCKFCDFETICPQRLAQKALNKRAPKTTSIPISDADSGELKPFSMGS